MKTMIYLFLILIRVSAWADQPTYTIKWQLHHRPIEFAHHAAQKFKSEIERESQGRIRVEIIKHTGTLDSDPRSHLDTAALKSGEVQMMQVYLTEIATVDPARRDLLALELPFIFENQEHVNRVVDGAVGQDLLNGLRGNGYRGLAFTYSGGNMVLVSPSNKIAKFEDLKGLRARITGGSQNDEAFALLETVPAKQPADNSRGNLVGALNEKLVDVAEVSNPDLIDLYDRVDSKLIPQVVNVTNHRILFTALLANENFYSELPKDLQQMVERVAKRVAVSERAYIVDVSRKNIAKLKKRKITVTELKAGERQRWREKMEPVYSSFKSQVQDGAKLIERITHAQPKKMDVTKAY